jgi:hypothetical protein
LANYALTTHNHDTVYEKIGTVTTVTNQSSYAFNVTSPTIALDITLNQNLTLTFTGTWGSGEQLRTIYLRSGTNYTVTWPTIAWEGGSAPTLDAFTIVTIGTLDGGTNIFGVFGIVPSEIRPTWVDWRDSSPAPVFDALLITDLATNSNTTVTSASFTSSAINGKYIVGKNIPANTTLTWVSGTTATLSNAATGTGTSIRAVYGTDNLASFNAFVTTLVTASAVAPVVGYIYGSALLMGTPTSLGTLNGLTLQGRSGVLTSSKGPSQGTLGNGTVFPPTLPPSTLVVGASTPTVSDGATTNLNNTVTSATANFQASTDIGIPISGTNIPAGAHITGVTNSTTVLTSHRSTGTGSSITLTLGRPFLNIYETGSVTLQDVAVLNMSTVFKGIKISAQSHSVSASKGGLRVENCTIGDWADGVISGYGLHTGRQWSPRLNNVHFWGNDVQWMVCDDQSFCNNAVAIGCVFDRMGTVGIRNMSEGFNLYGPAFGSKSDGTYRLIDSSHGSTTAQPAGGTGVGTTIDGALISGMWVADTNGGTGNWILLYGDNASQGLTVDGMYGGPTTGYGVVQLQDSNFRGLVLRDMVLNSGSAIDLNGQSPNGWGMNNVFRASGDPLILGGVTSQNLSLYASSAIVEQPSTQTISAVTDTISNTVSMRLLNNGGTSKTMTSAPTIADGTDGQILTLVNVGTGDIVIRDQGTLANSNLRLLSGGTTYTMSTRDNITFVFSSTIGDWVELYRTNVT